MNSQKLQTVAQNIATGTACPSCGARFDREAMKGGRCSGCGSIILSASPTQCQTDAQAFLARSGDQT